MTEAHATDVSRALASLVQLGLLAGYGRGRGMYYGFKGDGDPHTPLFSGTFEAQPGLPADGREPSSVISDPSSVISDPAQQDAATSEEEVTSATTADPELRRIASEARKKGRVDPEAMENIIRELCQDRWLKLLDIADLVQRRPQTVRAKYLTPMVEQGTLRFRYPEEPNHPQQSYTTAAPERGRDDD